MKVAYDKLKSAGGFSPSMSKEDVQTFFDQQKKKWNTDKGQGRLKDAGFSPHRLDECTLKVHFGHKVSVGLV